jgi:hypothetical protein
MAGVAFEKQMSQDSFCEYTGTCTLDMTNQMHMQSLPLVAALLTLTHDEQARE